jgi:hypothetical protein
MKNFNDIFRRKVKEAFDNYNADHLTEEGWNAFTRKNGRKRNRAIIIPLWAKAATIAVLVTIGVIFTARINHRNAGELVNQIALENRSELTESAINKEDTAAVSPVIANPCQGSETTVSKAGQLRHEGRGKTDSRVGSTAGPALAETVKIRTVKTEPVKAERSHLSETKKTDRLLFSDTSMAAGSLFTDTPIPPESLLSENIIAPEMSAWMNLTDNPIEIRLIDDADTGLKLKRKETLQVFDEPPREKMTTTIMGGLSGMMASINNTTSTSQGVSIGFYVEQQLTRRISVRPGLAMAKHNYAMESVPGGSIAMDYAAPELSGMSGTTTSYDANIEVVSMEVPVNLVFSIRKRARSNLFVTTGASTVVYLSQHMSGSFNNTYTKTTVDSYGGVSYESKTTSVKIESEQEILNRVDFLGLANFSAGYSFPFGKTSHLVFEPFVQFPIKDLTSQNLRIRYGGLSMKLQF